MTRKLIERFFNDECDEAERQKVISLLKDDSQLFDEYLSESEWNNFIKNEKLNPKISKKIFNKINRQTNTKSRIIPLIKKIAIAACIILVTGLGWKYFPNQDHMEELAIKESKTKIVDTLNNRNELMEITLPDNSKVDLEPGSRLKYSIPIGTKTRNVSLSGAAIFHIAKDSSKPFTVISGEIATTALGTVFKVIAFKNEPTIHVRLFEGKVVMSKNEDNNKNLERDYFLSPGEEFKFDKRTNVASTFLFNNIKIKSINQGSGNTKTQNVSTDEISNWYKFENQNLAEVFKNLESIYNVKIEFNNQSIRRMNFIGKIEKQDSIEMILRDIARINSLTVSKKGKTYFITTK